MLRRFVDLIADTWILDLAAGLLLGFATLMQGALTLAAVVLLVVFLVRRLAAADEHE